MTTPLRYIGMKLAVLGLVMNIFTILSIAILFPDGRNPDGISTFTSSYLLLLATLLALLALLMRQLFRGRVLTPARRIAVVRAIVIGGSVVALVYHLAQGMWFHHGYPNNTFLYNPVDRFMDFFNIVNDCAGRNPFARQGGYLPFGYFIGYLLAIFPPWQAALVKSVLLFVCCLVWYGMRQLTAVGQRIPMALFTVITITVLSYPFLFAVDRGNFDLLICLLTILFFIALEQHRDNTAGTLLGLSVAAKAYTVVYALLLIQQKRYRAALLAAVTVITMNLLSLALFQGGLVESTRQFFAALRGSVSHGVFSNALYVRFSSSLYTFFVVGLSAWFPKLYESVAFFKYYNYAALLLALALTGYLLNYERTRWRQVTLLTIAMILLPFASGDYRMIFLLLPLWMYLGTRETSRFDRCYVLLFGLLLIPKNYGILTGDRNIAMLLNPVLLVLLTLTLLAHNYAERRRHTDCVI